MKGSVSADRDRYQDERIDAIAATEALLARGPDFTSRSRFGVAGGAWRRLSRVLLRNYSVYQREVDESLVDAMRELEDRISRSNRR
jgi:hypothetical protein